MKKLKASALFYPLIVSLVVLVLFVLFWWLVDDKHIPVLMPSGEVADKQQQLIAFTVGLSAVVVIPVFAMLAGFAYRYREGNDKATYKPDWSDNNILEIIWWGIPILIIVLLSVITYLTSHSLDPYKPIESDKRAVKVQVVALQWKWLFLYPELNVATVNELTIPVDRPVHFSLSADAPMSAFWIPELGSQIYSMNGMTSQLNLIANKPGTFKGYNTNINGKGYADMTFDTKAVSQKDFNDWVKRHSQSGHVLNEPHLAELSEPSVLSAPMYMRLEDPDLYDSVIMKYMKHDTEHETEYDQSSHHEGSH